MKNIIPTKSIVDLHQGDTGLLADINLERNDLSRCMTLGLTPGAEITMIQNKGYGPLIVKVRGSQIALGRKQAAQVHITGSL
jgi:ferrous iron transport protein A